MFIASVLVGRSTLGNAQMKRPPPLDPNSPLELFDSCVNFENDPTIYVIFERDQCYPRYLITYKDDITGNNAPNVYQHMATTPVGHSKTKKKKRH